MSLQSTAIHLTAIIDSNSEIDPSVTIGAFSIIEANVKIGANCSIASNVRIFQGTEMGENNRMDHGAVIGCEPQDLSYDASVLTRTVIGHHNIFREGSNISRGSSSDKPTTIGNHNYFMASTHAGHDCVFGDHNIITQGAAIAGHVLVGNHAIISGAVAVHQFCHLGDYSMTAGCSKIIKDVPPFAVADGNPATLIGINTIGLRRAGFTAAQRTAIKQTYQTIYKKSLKLEDALNQLEQNKAEEIEKITQFYRDSNRGVTSHR